MGHLVDPAPVELVKGEKIMEFEELDIPEWFSGNYIEENAGRWDYRPDVSALWRKAVPYRNTHHIGPARDQTLEEVAVVGVYHPKWVEAVTAVIKLKTNKKLTEEVLMDHCKNHLSPFKVPKKIIFVEELVKTPTGKILKRDMRKQYEGLFV